MCYCSSGTGRPFCCYPGSLCLVVNLLRLSSCLTSYPSLLIGIWAVTWLRSSPNQMAASVLYIITAITTYVTLNFLLGVTWSSFGHLFHQLAWLKSPGRIWTSSDRQFAASGRPRGVTCRSLGGLPGLILAVSVVVTWSPSFHHTVVTKLSPCCHLTCCHRAVCPETFKRRVTETVTWTFTWPFFTDCQEAITMASRPY